MEENYIQHINIWWWGKTITLIHKNGLASVEIQFDSDYQNMAFIKSLIVFEYKRKKGIGTDLLLLSEKIAKRYDKRFIQLSVDINKKWLVKWYEKNGYIITYKDEHEYTMLKALSIEQKAEAYDEDERIRKVLIGWIHLESTTNFSDSFDGFSKEQILTWFEKVK